MVVVKNKHQSILIHKIIPNTKENKNTFRSISLSIYRIGDQLDSVFPEQKKKKSHTNIKSRKAIHLFYEKCQIDKQKPTTKI